MPQHKVSALAAKRMLAGVVRQARQDAVHCIKGIRRFCFLPSGTGNSRRTQLRRVHALCMSSFLLIAGCGGSSMSPIVNPSGGLASMPTPPAPGPANIYTGTESLGVWSLSLDDSKNTFTYSESGSSTPPVSGTFQNTNGFFNLGKANGASLGYVLEVQGRMALLRPGDNSAHLIVSVPQTSCYSIPYRLRFDYVPMEAAAGSATFTNRNYASVIANTNSNGGMWQYQALQGSPVSGPTSFTGSCSGGSLSVTGPSLFNLDNNGASLFPYTNTNTDVIATSLAIGPSGIFVSYQTDTSFTFRHISAGTAGVAEPTAPLSTSSIAAGTYLGFLTVAAQDQLGDGTIVDPGYTSPLSFGQTASSGTTMFGGDFPNDDVTQQPNSDISINFGSQNGTLNGLYPSATITMLDPNQNCLTSLVLNPKLNLTPGTNVQGYPTCTFPAIAVVGNPEGNYVIFIDTFNYTANSIATQIGAPMQMYLYQQ